MTVLVLALGCSRPSAKVSGKVYYNGKVLRCGNVTFISTEGKQSVSTRINEDGTYTLPTAPTGNVKICVETESLNPKRLRGLKYSPPAGQKAPEGFESATTDIYQRYTWIPEHYADPEKSGLTYVVKSSTHEYDIKLEGEAR
jgi:hypothetical protein